MLKVFLFLYLILHLLLLILLLKEYVEILDNLKERIESSTTIDDINFEENIITIRSAVSERFIDNDKEKGLEKYVKIPKNGKERIIYMTPLAREIVEYLIAQVALKCRSNPNNLLFPSYIKNGTMRSMDAFEIQFKQLSPRFAQ